MLHRAGIVACLLIGAIVLGADASEYPSLNRAGIRALARGALPLLCLGALNLMALDGPIGRGRAVAIWLAIGGNVALVWWVARFLGVGEPPIVWILGAAAALLLVGSLYCGLRVSVGGR